MQNTKNRGRLACAQALHFIYVMEESANRDYPRVWDREIKNLNVDKKRNLCSTSRNQSLRENLAYEFISRAQLTLAPHVSDCQHRSGSDGNASQCVRVVLSTFGAKNPICGDLFRMPSGLLPISSSRRDEEPSERSQSYVGFAANLGRVLHRSVCIGVHCPG